MKKYMSIYQSSSPSYVLMAGIDRCIELIENDKEKLFKDYIDNLCWFYSKVSSLKYIKVICKEDLQVFDFDYGKIIITCASNIELVNDSKTSFGEYIYRKLYDRYKIQLEMKSVNYALAMTSICDTREGFQRLADALCDIDKHIFNDFKVIDKKKELNYQHNILEIYCTVTEADKYLKKEIDFDECVNQVSANYVYLFPPGIPLVVPGEIISEDIYINILNYLKCGFEVHGITKNKKISVLEIA